MENADWSNSAQKVYQWRTLREYGNNMSECIRSGKFRNLLRNLASQEGPGHGNNNTVISLVNQLVSLLVSWLIGWLLICLVGHFGWGVVGLFGQLAILSVLVRYCFFTGLVSWMSGYLVNFLFVCLVYLLVVYLVSKSVGCLVVWLFLWLLCWLGGWMSG